MILSVREWYNQIDRKGRRSLTTERQTTDGEAHIRRDDISDTIYTGAGVSKKRAPETEPIMILPATAGPQEWAEEKTYGEGALLTVCH